MRHFCIGARASTRQGFKWVSIAALFAVFFAASTASAALTFDLRAVSGSQVTIHGPKSVAVNQSSVGGWIDFELHAFVTGQNNSSNDEALHSFAGNIFSTHFGLGAVSGDLINTGEIAPRVRRGIAAPFDHFGYSDGWAQNLDGDPDREIGGTGESYWNHNTLVPTSTLGAIIGRGNPFNVYGYAGDDGLADFLLYRFTLPIASLLAGGLDDLTSIHFEPWNGNAAGHWREDGLGTSRTNGGTVAVGESVLIHTAEAPIDIASIPEPGAWLLGTTALAGLVFARRRRGGRLVAMPRSFSTSVWLAAISVLMTASSANAALTFDLRAVSGSRVAIVNGPKSVAINGNSVGGWIDFELWGVVTGSNNTPSDDSIKNFAGDMLSDQRGNGAVEGSMINSGEMATRVRRGVAQPFDNNGYRDGAIRNLDEDPDFEIGGTDPVNYIFESIAGRAGTTISYTGSKSVAEFLLYRFTLPITGINAQGVEDITDVRFSPHPFRTSFLWAEDSAFLSAATGSMNIAPSVLIHTAQTPEELAAIPEPGTWALGFSGMVGAGWFARRRRRR